ncbi:Fe-S cluster assembly protein HesB [uncultured Plantibacter sp.]|uniref:Fe-S cluster assembly protein HesB n=1 Tax=uncultured Plantibacter sp. TaxID=293337 RepID=UPI0028D42A79|nr:Fe-S cluster assembly protein HesB [uncultured Plantibacter sp.]
MLTLTENAGRVVKTLAENAPLTPGLVVPDDASSLTHGAGLRISSSSDDNNFEVTMTATPHEADQVIESAGATVFLEESAAIALSDAVLDAQIDEQGGVRFALGKAE